jgi:hypothetical protein
MDDETMPEPMTPSQLADLRGRSDASMPWTQAEREALLGAAEERDRLRERCEALRKAHLVHVYQGELSVGCRICSCTWDPGADEWHDADCLAAPEPTDGK